jgi:hypothetical protein
MKHRALVVAALVLALARQALPAVSPRPLDSLFPGLPGWRQGEKVELFQPETLYEHIDGAADNFLNYGFEQLAVQTYNNEQKQSLSAEIYFHGTPENAFGIYSSEKPLAGTYLNIGAQGYAEEGVLNFVSDAYYVKLNGFGLGRDDRAVLSALAEKITLAIAGSNALPGILAAFPTAGKIANSERFLLNNFLGHEFLRSAYVADYRVDGHDFQLFIISAESETAARAMLEKYAALIKGKPAPDIQPGQLAIDDPYNGPIRMIWQGRFICGSGGTTPAAAERTAAAAKNLAGL